MEQISFKPIGVVRSGFKVPEDLHFACEDGLKSKTISTIAIRGEFEPGLEGMDKFSHIFVIYFLDKVNKTELVTHPGPPSVEGLPKVGVFASRCQYRPNPIALRLVELLNIEKNELRVRGLDAIDGSPVLDIKPYVPGFDRPAEAKAASWYSWLG